MITRIAFLLVFIWALPFSIENKEAFPINIDFFEVDVIGNLYFAKDAEIRKYNSNGELLNTYSDLSYGSVTTLDVSDAMNILVYYRDFNKIVMLDNKLSIKNSPIDLIDLGYAETNFACLSYNNGIWIFDPVGQELLRFNQLLENTDRTGNLSSLTSYSLNPVQIIERDNQLVLRDNENGIFVFDRYGGYIRRLPFFNFDDLFIRSNSWQMLRNDTNFIFNPITLNMDTIPLPYSQIAEFRINDNAYYIRFKDKSFVRKLVK